MTYEFRAQTFDNPHFNTPAGILITDEQPASHYGEIVMSHGGNSYKPTDVIRSGYGVGRTAASLAHKLLMGDISGLGNPLPAIVDKFLAGANMATPGRLGKKL